MPKSRIVLICEDDEEFDALGPGLSQRIEFERQPSLPASFEGLDLVWCHSAAAKEPTLPRADLLSALLAFVEEGGRLLLSGATAAWTGPLGIEENPPKLEQRVWRGPLRPEDRLGVAPFITHPLFDRFPGGLYLRRPQQGAELGGAYYRAGDRPIQGRLLGVEKVHLGLQPETGLLVEHEVGEGRVLSLGAHLSFKQADGTHDLFEEERLRFTADMLDYLLSVESGVLGSQWPVPAQRCSHGHRIERRTLEQVLGRSPIFSEGLAERAPFFMEGSTLASSGSAQDFLALCNQSGVLLLGGAGPGVKELWRLPLRYFQDVEWSVIDAGEVDASEFQFRSLRHMPEGIERKFGREGDGLCETWVLDQPEAGVVGQLANERQKATTIEFRFAAEQRLQWPYPRAALGSLRVATDDDERLLLVQDSALGYTGLWLFNKAPLTLEIVENSASRVLEFRYRFELKASETLDWRISCAPSENEARATLEALCDGTSDPLANALAYRRKRRELGLRMQLELHSENPENAEHPENAVINNAIEWIKAKVDDFFVRIKPHDAAPELAGYLAGFQHSRPGWLDGRPGYAWFFARDALWLTRALLPWGDFDRVRDCLRLLARFQGPRGTIFHELTATGLAHFDAADSTAMFVEALGRYVAWTGDTSFAEELWTNVERAIAFLQEQDKDADSIAARNAGHAWVEEGPFREAVQVELYLACFQVKALEAAVQLGKNLGQKATIDLWEADARRARERIEEDFANADGVSYAHALDKDGDFDRTLTVLGCMPVLHGITRPMLAARVQERFARSEFCSPQGLRFVANDDARYDPESYQAGSVWPLFTGWVALADFLAGRPDTAWARMQELFALLGSSAPGVLGEAYHGERGEPIGVCPQQATSHAAVLGPLTEGLLGVRPSLDGEMLLMQPCLPGAIDSITFEGLRYRGLVLDGTVARLEGGNVLHIDIEVGGEGQETLEFSAYFPGPCEVLGVKEGGVQEGGESLEYSIDELGEGIVVRLAPRLLRAESKVQLFFEVRVDLLFGSFRGSAVDQDLPVRLIARRPAKDGKELHIELETKPGLQRIPVRLPGRRPCSLVGARIEESAAAGAEPAHFLCFEQEGEQEREQEGEQEREGGYHSRTLCIRF